MADTGTQQPAKAVLDALKETVENASVRTVFGEPVTQDGTTLVPAARIMGRGGGGGGTGQRPQEEGAGTGAGGGFALSAKPIGAFVIRAGRVGWRPAVDVNKVILGGQIVALAVVIFQILKSLRKR